MITVYAYTERDQTPPGYLNITQHDNGLAVVTLRARGEQLTTSLTMTSEELSHLRDSLNALFAST